MQSETVNDFHRQMHETSGLLQPQYIADPGSIGLYIDKRHEGESAQMKDILAKARDTKKYAVQESRVSVEQLNKQLIDPNIIPEDRTEQSVSVAQGA